MWDISLISTYICCSIGKNVDASQVTRMADYFMQLKQFDKAVDLLAAIDRVSLNLNFRKSDLQISP